MRPRTRLARRGVGSAQATPAAVDKSASLREQKPSPSAPSCPPRRRSPAWTTRSPSPRSWTIAIPSTPSLACALIVHDHTETPSAISLKRASTIAEIRMLAWAINAWLLRKAAKVASAQAIVPAQRRRHAFFVSEVTAARLNTGAALPRAAPYSAAPTSREKDVIVTSAVVGAVTGSTALGFLAGGSLLGAAVRSALSGAQDSEASPPKHSSCLEPECPTPEPSSDASSSCSFSGSGDDD